MPAAISPATVSVIAGPDISVNAGAGPAEVVSIEIFVPPPAGVTVAAAKAELGAKNPPAINAAAINTKDDARKTFKTFSRERERETRF